MATLDVYRKEDEEETKEDSVEYAAFKYKESELKKVKNMTQFHERFKLGKRLGGGGDGDVFRDMNKDWPAIKKVHLSDFEDPQHEIDRARQEQRLLAKARLLNIYGIYFDESTQTMYKIYDRCDYSLEDVVTKLEENDLSLTEQQTKSIIFDICCDMKRLHRQNFIHCDLKPSNILYCKKGTFKKNYSDKQTWKVIDYDGALWNETNDIICCPWQGTLPWISPEMNDFAGDDNNIGYESDVWSIGLLILYCINGGHLGKMDICDDNLRRFYQEYEEEDEVEIKSEIFDDWYEEVFGVDAAYKTEIDDLYKNKKVSKTLYNLLRDGIFQKKQGLRMDINKVLQHAWFNDESEEDFDPNIKINKEQIDFFDAITSKNKSINRQVMAYQKRKFSMNDDVKMEEESPEIRYYSDDPTEEHLTVSNDEASLWPVSSPYSRDGSADNEALKTSIYNLNLNFTEAQRGRSASI